MINDDKEITKTIAEKVLNFFILAIAIIVVSGIFYFGCSGHSENIGIKPSHDSIYEDQNIQSAIFNETAKENAILTAKNDSLMKRKPIYIYRIKTKFDSLYFADTSCQNSLITLYNSFGDLNALNDSIIANNELRLKNDSIGMHALINLVNLKQSHITIDSTYITQLCDSIPRVKRKAFRKGLLKGIITAAIIVEGINIGSKLVP